jgi:hypothetical protein
MNIDLKFGSKILQKVFYEYLTEVLLKIENKIIKKFIFNSRISAKLI